MLYRVVQQALDELTPDASAEAVNMELSRIGNKAVLTVTDGSRTVDRR